MTVLVSALVLASYVAAAFVDCERPLDAGLLEAARLAAGVERAPHAMPARGHGTHAMAGHGDHEGHAGMDPAPTARSAAPPCHPEVVLVATCLCGCSETRGFVGGTLARLGATIPAVHVAALPAEVVIDGRPRIDLRLPAPFVVDDPIPI